jgi:TM2 domain-containing membrane protein YozV
LQTRDELTDDFPSRFREHRIAYDEPNPYPAGRRTLAVMAAWLIPGAGHLVLGKMGRGLLFLVTIAGSFALGLAFHGRLFWPVVSDPPTFFRFDLITVLWCFAQIGAGLCYIVSYLLGIGTDPQPWASTFEYGNALMFLAGLLNYLVIHDAFDIAAGRKR